MTDDKQISGDLNRISDDTAKPLVGALLEMFSPLSEGLGYLGDRIRFFRANSALRAINRAKSIADEQGVKLTSPPVKFLSQYIENSSLEEENDEQMVEWWARLLISAGSNYESKQIYYTQILKQITGIELELLEVLARNSKGHYKIGLIVDAEFHRDFNFFERDFIISDVFVTDSGEKKLTQFRNLLEFPGSILLDVFFDDENSNQYQDFHPDYNEEEIANWQILQSLQLVRIEHHKYRDGNVECRIRQATITQLGAEFYLACHEAEFPEKESNDVRYQRKYIQQP